MLTLMMIGLYNVPEVRSFDRPLLRLFGRPVSSSALSQRSLGHTEDFSLWLSREETSRPQGAPEILVGCRLAGVVLIPKSDG